MELQNNSAISAKFKIEAARLNYESILQSIHDIEFTRENVHQDLLANHRKLLKQLDNVKELMIRPLITEQREINSNHKGLRTPLEEAIEEKSAERARIAAEIASENAIIDAEKKKQAEISTAISDFIANITKCVSIATDSDQIVKIEKRIGSESSRTTFYGDSIADLRARCEAIRPSISRQKGIIKQIKELSERKSRAIEQNNESELVRIREKEEEIGVILNEAKLIMQNEAFNQIINIPVIVPESTTENVKSRRTKWKFEVEDIELLFKKMPELVELVPIKEKIKELLDQKKADGSLKGKTEERFFGIRFYEDKTF